MHLRVRPDRDEPGADSPTAVALVGHPWLAEELRVVVDERLRVVRSDEDVIEVHATPPVRSRWRSMVIPCPTTGSSDRSEVSRSTARRSVRRSRTLLLLRGGPSCPRG